LRTIAGGDDAGSAAPPGRRWDDEAPPPHRNDAALGYDRVVPPLIRRYIKTSFVFLLVGLALGGWIIVQQFVVGAYPPRLFVTAHVHLLLVGFMLMIVMGVATWMFPRPARDDARYRPELAEAVYWTMTVATALRASAEILGSFTPAPGLRLAIAVGGLGQLAATVLFVLNMWTRVRMPTAAAPPRA
jgi:heme/copper-type cytochrome/quinol oxidase subunit 1